jgi:hypothetical protein
MGMNIEFSKETDPKLFQAVVRVVEYICDKYQTRNEEEVIGLIQQDFGVRLMRKDGTIPTTIWIAHFASEKACTMFMLRWS